MLPVAIRAQLPKWLEATEETGDPKPVNLIGSRGCPVDPFPIPDKEASPQQWA
jgi:hypothetical protein